MRKYSIEDVEVGFDEFRRANVDRCEKLMHAVDAWSETDWGCALAGEVGELCNNLKKRRRGDRVDVGEVAEEMADIITYLDLLAVRMRIDLGEALWRKFNTKSKEFEIDVLFEHASKD